MRFKSDCRCCCGRLGFVVGVSNLIAVVIVVADLALLLVLQIWLPLLLLWHAWFLCCWCFKSVCRCCCCGMPGCFVVVCCCCCADLIVVAGLIHSAQLTGLLPDHVYHYRISGDTQARAFKTAPAVNTPQPSYPICSAITTLLLPDCPLCCHRWCLLCCLPCASATRYLSLLPL